MNKVSLQLRGRCGAVFLFVVLLSLARLCAEAAESEFEVDVLRGFSSPIELKDGRLLSVDRNTHHALHSSDGGRTWKKSGPLVDSSGAPIAGKKSKRSYLISLIRLNSGAIGLKFEKPQPGSNGQTSKRDAYFSRSSDEGRTWTVPVQITWSHAPSNATWMIQMKSGRLVLPNEYWRTQAGDRGIGICTAFYSDDAGRSWHESRDSLWVWEKKGAAQGGCEVPSVVETADGRLLMFMRTWYGRIAQSQSKDGGRTWSRARLNNLVSSNSELFLTQVPIDNDLLCVWNQASRHEIETGFYRARLTSAISKDNGRTWQNFRTLAMSPGQKKIGRVVNPGPPAFLRTPTAVPPEKEMRSDEFHMNRAPRVTFIGDKAYLIYTHRRYKYTGGKLKRLENQNKLRVLPITWFYETKR